MTSRRQLIGAGVASGLVLQSTSVPAFWPALIRIVIGATVRGSATAAGRAVAGRIVTREIMRGGVKKTVQTYATAELGITIAGVSALSVTAAELISKYECKSICVQGVSDTAEIVSEALKRPTHVTINIVNSVDNTIEDHVREYVNAGNFRYSFTLPRRLGLGVKRLNGKADDDASVPVFSSGNILLAGVDDVFYS